MSHPPQVRPVVILALAAGIAVLGATTQALTPGARSDLSSFGKSLAHGLFVWLLFGILSLIAVAAARRFPITRGQWLRHLPAHLVALVTISVTHTIIYNAVMLGWIRGTPGVVVDVIRNTAASNLRGDTFIYAMMVGAYYLYAMSERSRERERALTAAKLEALKGQLQPHFLFNTLNSISTLVLKGDRDRALQMLSRLADLLRTTLTTSATQTLPLEEELDIVRRYLDIEAVRFADRLRTVIDVSDDARSVHVPVLLLQPIVENAIRHGIAAGPNAGSLEIRATRVNGTVRIEVRDDGPGLASAPTAGVGLVNTRERLEQLYGSGASFTLERDDHWTVACVKIPV